MDNVQFTIYGFDVKIKFIQYMRAIAPLVGLEKPGLKAAKEIADKVEAGRPLTIVVGWDQPDLCLVLKNYAKAIGAKTENFDTSVMDFHAEVRNSPLGWDAVDNDDFWCPEPDQVGVLTLLTPSCS